MYQYNNHLNLVSLWEMSKVETIEEFYKRKFNWIPNNLRNVIGHFNIFHLEPIISGLVLFLILHTKSKAIYLANTLLLQTIQFNN